MYDSSKRWLSRRLRGGRVLAAGVLFVGVLAARVTDGQPQEPEELPTLTIEGVRDETDEERVFLEVRATSESCFLGESVAVDVRFGIEEAFLEEKMIPLFRRALEVPVQLQGDWLATSRAAETRMRTVSFSVEGAVAHATRGQDELRERLRYTVFEHRLYVTPRAEGVVTLSAPLLRYAYATSFRTGFLTDPVPEDRFDAFVLGNEVTITVRELPLEARPDSFTGGFGEFTIRGRAEPREVTLGESLRLTLEVRGSGELDAIGAPRVHLPHFHLQASSEERRADACLFIYDLAPRRVGNREIDAIPFSFFDPAVGYRTIETKPIPIAVSAPPIDIRELKSVSTLPRESSAGELNRAVLYTVSFAPWLLAALVGLGVRRRNRPRPDALLLRVTPAADAFRRDGERPVDEALITFLAACLDEKETAVVSHDLGGRLAALGLPEGLARRASSLLDALQAPRYGGPVTAGAAEATDALVDEIEAAIARRGGRR